MCKAGVTGLKRSDMHVEKVAETVGDEDMKLERGRVSRVEFLRIMVEIARADWLDLGGKIKREPWRTLEGAPWGRKGHPEGAGVVVAEFLH